jgi:tetratricopeptide (TPR) repeat protein
MEVAALIELERWREARRAVKARLRERPDDTEALEQLANLETGQGNFARAEAILERLAARPDADSVVFNNLAWVALFRRAPEARDLERAVKANALSRGRSPGELHTLAALYAERGDTEETVELVRRRLELRDAAEPESMDYYLFGRVMEHLGLWRLAEQAYLRVEKDEGGRADSTHALAQRRLRGLRKRSAI